MSWMKFDSYTNDKLWSTVDENQPWNIKPFKCKEKRRRRKLSSGRIVFKVQEDFPEENLWKTSLLALPNLGIYELILD